MTLAQLLALAWLVWGLWIFGRAYEAAHKAYEALGRPPKRGEVEVQVNALPWLLLAVLLCLVVLL